MTTVRNCLDLKPNILIAVGPGDMVVTALELMRTNRVRAVLVFDKGLLAGIITQGDCAIKVLLPGLDAKDTLVKDVMTAQPITVQPSDPLETCMGLMAQRNFRHLPVSQDGQVVGVISIGDVVKNYIRELGTQIDFLETYIKGHGA
jgi:CBS domain-containing protein